MKATRQLDRLEPLVLHRVRGLEGDEWHRAPDGKWSIAQIVEHLSIGLDLVVTYLGRRADKRGMQRRSRPYQSVLRHLVLGVGRIPGGLEAPEVARPSDSPDPELITAQFRMGIEKLREYNEVWTDAQKENVFVAHPFLGDLNLPEWARFYYVHCRHHGKQIEQRKEWLARERSYVSEQMVR